MARTAAGVRLDVEYIVQASLGRTYEFDWTQGTAADLSVEHNGTALEREAYSVTLGPNGVGGTVTLAASGPHAATLAEGDRIRLLRDTVANERAAFGDSGFATAHAARVMSEHVLRLLQELATRLQVHGDIILSDDEINTLIASGVASGVKPYAVSGGPDIALGNTDFGGTVEQSLDRNRCRYDTATHTIVLVSNDGTELRLTLPQAGEAHAGLPAHGQADAGQVLTVESDGQGVSWDPVTGAKVVLDASGFNGNLASGDTDAQKLAAKVDALALGLGRGAVDLRIAELVPGWARMAQRFTDKQREVFNAFEGDAWQDSTTIKVATTFSTTATPSNPENLTYQSEVVTGPRYTNVYAVLEVPDGEAASREHRRLLIGQLPPVVLDGATQADAAAGNTYYTVLLADVPASTTLKVQEREAFQMDPNRVANVPADWAVRGQPRPRTSDFQLRNGALQGLSVTHSARNVFGNLQLYSPTVDLDSTDYSRAKFSSRVRVTLSQKSDAGISFHATNAQDSIEISGFTFSSLVKAYTSGQTTGDLIASAPVHLSGGTIGTVEFYLADNANNELGVQVAYKGSTGSSSFALGFHEVTDADGVHPADSGTAPRSFLVSSSPSSTVSVTTAEQTADVNTGRLAGWTSPWTTVVELPPMLAHQAGRVNVQAHVYGARSTAPTDNGDRMNLQSRLIRTRGSVDTVLLEQIDYGPRSLFSGASPLYANATLVFSEELVKSDLAQHGDVYKVQVKTIQQKPSGARTLDFNTSPIRNFMEVIPIGP